MRGEWRALSWTIAVESGRGRAAKTLTVEGWLWCPRRRMRLGLDGVEEAGSRRLARLTAEVADWMLNGREIEVVVVKVDALSAKARAWSYASRP